MMWLHKMLHMCCIIGHKGYLCISKALILVNQITSMTPISFVTARLLDGSKASTGYHAKRIMTILGCVHLMVLTLVAPFIVQHMLKLYSLTTNQKENQLFKTIALIAIVIDVIIVLVILGIQIVKRHKLAIFVNLLMELVNKIEVHAPYFIGVPFFAMLLIKVGYKLYVVLVNVPFMIRNSHEIGPLNLLIIIGTMYLHLLLAIYAIDIFAILLFLNAAYEWLESAYKHALKVEKLPYLMELNELGKDLRVLIKLFTHNFQIGIALILFVDFINLLASLYAVSYYALSQNDINFTLISYATAMAVDYYITILAAHLCYWKQINVRDLLLNRECSQSIDVCMLI